jgi:hypothetical protein
LFIVAFRAPLEPFFYAASLSSMGTLPVPAQVGQSLSMKFSGPMLSLLPWRLPVPRQSGQGAYLAFMAIHLSYKSGEDFTAAGSRTTKSGEEKIIGAKPATSIELMPLSIEAATANLSAIGCMHDRH